MKVLFKQDQTITERDVDKLNSYQQFQLNKYGNVLEEKESEPQDQEFKMPFGYNEWEYSLLEPK